ncbi:MAG: Gfo/Idh/MocA family oxidoreductase [Chloroflexi bacterium]|jgi:UDP-2-acetamido-3-amino-2,3-dideoxy-glucuronate N-acetyltransferase|nr:Gfo/Idh/MocA family oxidoreductase [Chloroflexota bacterium]MBT7079969.1 Gfo/Idh/MocA family oxidoreductase [Chloroflexota bacterium]MBT7289501.1 Gfo/Idh/MocA family oxidoreductase [Chloroflexota bacterium]
MKNIAVVGGGYWGKNLVRNFAELGGLHTICDSNEQTLLELKERYPGVNTETDYARLLSNIDIKGVVISSPAVMHFAMAKQAMLAGKDVFVEKPLALKIEDGQELVDIAQKLGRILLVGHILEYHPAIVMLKEMVNSGELGTIQYIYSNRLNLGKFRTEENILWSFAPHDISVILLLLDGQMPNSISGHGGYYLHKDIADVTMTTMSFASGTRAHIFVSWLHPYKEQRLVIVGSQKMAVFNDTEPKDKLLIYDHSIDWVDNVPVPNRKDARSVEIQTAEPLKSECQDFIDCIKERKKPRVDGHKGLQVLKLLSYCQNSLERDGEEISLE